MTAGQVERAVLADLKTLEPRKPRQRRSTLAELALTVARKLDADPPITQVAKLATELRVLLGELREVARGRVDGAPASGLGAPDWDSEESGASDVGQPGGGGGPPAG